MVQRERNAADISSKLRRLWKGTLYTGIIGAYIFLLGMFFVHEGWQSALLVLFLICLAQLFRYIANDVDRLGWLMNEMNISEEQSEVKQYQSKMFLLSFSLIQFSNIAIIYKTHSISTAYLIFVGIGILIIEVTFRQIRNVNQSIDYETASYGIKDSGPITDGPAMQGAKGEKEKSLESINEKIDKKIAKLREMAEQGDISQKAYENVRDRELVNRIMKGQ